MEWVTCKYFALTMTSRSKKQNRIKSLFSKKQNRIKNLFPLRLYLKNPYDVESLHYCHYRTCLVKARPICRTNLTFYLLGFLTSCWLILAPHSPPIFLEYFMWKRNRHNDPLAFMLSKQYYFHLFPVFLVTFEEQRIKGCY